MDNLNKKDNAIEYIIGLNINNKLIELEFVRYEVIVRLFKIIINGRIIFI